MEERILHITEAEHGLRLDQALGALCEDYSRTALRALIDEGKILVDGRVEKPRFKVSLGQEILMQLPKREALEAEPQDLPINVIYEDEDILILDKNAGLVVHPGSGVTDGTLMNALLFHYPQTATLPRAGIVHRLDKDTSGLMVVALNETAQQKLMAAISKHEVVREYDAIAEGLITAGGTVDAPIGRDLHNRTRMAVMPEGMGREAVTHYRVAEHYRAHTRLRLRLETGRTHQIRVHMAYLHHPLLGDPQYGGRRLRHLAKASPELEKALLNFRRQALHAAHLELVHPATGETLAFDAAVPPDLQNLMDLLRKDNQEHGI